MTVEELFDASAARLGIKRPICNIFEAISGVMNIITNRLLLKRSPLLAENLLLEYLANDTEIDLPSEFIAPDGLPTVSGSGTVIRPLRSGTDTAAASLTAAGDLEFYIIKGRTMTLYPPPDADGTLIVPAFVRPILPTEMDDDLPWWGTFDDVFNGAVVIVLEHGLGAVADQEFVAIIGSQVDQVLLAIAQADEQAEADAINYDASTG